MGKNLLAYGLPGLLIGILIGLLIGRLGPFSGGQPIIISDDLLVFTAGAAFKSWPTNTASGTISEIYPSYTFNGIDVIVDGTSKTGCPNAAQTCDIGLTWETASPTVYVHYDPNAGNKLTLRSAQTPFDRYPGYNQGLIAMVHPDFTKKVTQVAVTVGGTAITPYPVSSSCKITIK